MIPNIIKDKHGKILKVGDRVKFFVGESENDPFLFWVEGVAVFEFDLLHIREDMTEGADSLWVAYNKRGLEILN